MAGRLHRNDARSVDRNDCIVHDPMSIKQVLSSYPDHEFTSHASLPFTNVFSATLLALKGWPLHTTRSASFPLVILPIRSSSPRIFAGLIVMNSRASCSPAPPSYAAMAASSRRDCCLLY